MAEIEETGGEFRPKPREDRRGNGRKSLSLRSPGSLERLRDRLEFAAAEARRSREESMVLAERLNALDLPGADLLPVSRAAMEEEMDLLRRKVSGFAESVERINYRQDEPGPAADMDTNGEDEEP